MRASGHTAVRDQPVQEIQDDGPLDRELELALGEKSLITSEQQGSRHLATARPRATWLFS